ncbi:hypothetical protein [Candidatus Absconditicoccus praedator]|uniref:hypothetical protein n=1 Tax=Candidatus Absconditicoccus praedator TaxID=2735562 RepID=UPI001E30D0A4|nr:hypothetical protein [Candidatus Absconditicoccus praedator]UFX83226.1 hypothetical protein HLG78_03800 [Candidatus Absconditicoccus praedator]
MLEQTKNKYNLDILMNVLDKKGYKIFTQKYIPNIIGVRDIQNIDCFDDVLILFYFDENSQPSYQEYSITTLPGMYYLKNPPNTEGTAVLKEGQYLDLYRLGIHKQAISKRINKIFYKYLLSIFLKPFERKIYLSNSFMANKLEETINNLNSSHKALIQNIDEIPVYRENNRSGELKFEKNGFGTEINIHRASYLGKAIKVGNYSAGCQVFASRLEFDDFLEKIEKCTKKAGLVSIPYTLINKKDL